MSQVNSRVDDLEKVLGGEAWERSQDATRACRQPEKAHGKKLAAVESASASQPYRRPGGQTTDLGGRRRGKPTGATDLEDDGGNRKPTINRPLRGPAGVVVHWSQLTSLQYRQQLFEGFGDGVGRPKSAVRGSGRCQGGRQVRWG